jgi:hypothetical protein
MHKRIDWDRVRLPDGKIKLIRIMSEGEWSILPVTNSSHGIEWQSWHLGFRPTDQRSRNEMLESLEEMHPSVPDRSYWYAQALIGYDVSRHGEFWSEEAAITVANTLVYGEALGSVEVILSEAGFKPYGELSLNSYRGQDVPEQYYIKPVNGGAFKILLGVGAFLSLEVGENPTFDDDWEIASVSRNDGETHPFPLFWPARIEENFSVLALRSLIAVMDEYTSSGELAEDVENHMLAKINEKPTETA